MTGRIAAQLGVLGVLVVACTSSTPAEPERVVAWQPVEPPALEPVVPPPPVVPVAVEPPDAPIDPIAKALAPADPDAVTIVERKPIGKDTIVLYALDVLRLREAETPGVCDGVQLRTQSCVAKCGRSCSQAQRDACAVMDSYEQAGCRDVEDAYAWEVARVRTGESTLVVARARVWGPVLASTPAPEEAASRLKVYDMDRDGRNEVQVIVPIPIGESDEQQSEGDGEVGAIFDGGDLHLQFAATRRIDLTWQNVFNTIEHAEAAWVAKDTDGDGRPDLKLSHKGSTQDQSCDLECDEDVALRPQRTKATQVCPYEAAGDRWVCPSPQLGRELLEGNDGVRAIEAAGGDPGAETPVAPGHG